MSAPTFTRESITTGWRYATPAGFYYLTDLDGVWVLASPGAEVGRYPTIAAAETALNAHVIERMWN